MLGTNLCRRSVGPPACGNVVQSLRLTSRLYTLVGRNTSMVSPPANVTPGSLVRVTGLL